MEPAIDLGRIAPNLRSVCSGYLSGYRTDLEAQVRSGAPGAGVATRHAKVLDGLLGALFCAANGAAANISAARTAKRKLARRDGLALVAVGGYGRGLVGLHSDVDVLFLCSDPTDPVVAEVAEGVLYPIWDLGVSIGHAVRGIDETIELSRKDLSTATTLLDTRLVAGDEQIVHQLEQAARRSIFEPALDDFLDRLEKEAGDRHEKFGGSLYLLEPEVKLGLGGLRDLDSAWWAVKARWGNASVEEMVRVGALLSREAEELEEAREMLWRVRSLLHLRAGRRQDRLTFEDQEEVARSFGFEDGATLGVEQFMQTYYRHARVVSQITERVLARSRPTGRRSQRPAIDIGDGLILFDGHITFAESEQLEQDPVMALRLYKQVVRRQLPPYPFARDVIVKYAADADWQKRLRESPDAQKLFLQLLTFAGDVPLKRSSVLGELHEVGLMLAMVPEFEPVTGRVQHDVYHVYTVDVHSIAAVDRLRMIGRGEWATRTPVASRLAAEAAQSIPLFLGLFLHDVGKAYGKDHSKKGAVIARPIAERFGLSPADVEHVVWLVLEHLSLYHWATRRDTSDPEVIAEVKRIVGTQERLRDLYLLTVADLSTTNPNAMTSWKARMLEDLYLAVAAAFEGETPRGPRLEGIRADVRVGFIGDVGQKELDAFVDGMPERYLLSNPVDVIRAHARVARDRGKKDLHVATLPGSSDDVIEIVVVTKDRSGLLADVTAALTAHRLTIATAQIFTRTRGKELEAFDVFHVRRAGRGNEAPDAQTVQRFAKDLERLLKGKVTAQELVTVQRTPDWASRKAPEVPTEVRVDNGVSPRFTVIDVYTRDRSGLLHTIARTLHEQRLSIAISKVNTEGARVADVFYVVDEQTQEKVTDSERLHTLPIVLREAIQKLGTLST